MAPTPGLHCHVESAFAVPLCGLMNHLVPLFIFTFCFSEPWLVLGYTRLLTVPTILFISFSDSSDTALSHRWNPEDTGNLRVVPVTHFSILPGLFRPHQILQIFLVLNRALSQELPSYFVSLSLPSCSPHGICSSRSLSHHGLAAFSVRLMLLLDGRFQKPEATGFMHEGLWYRLRVPQRPPAYRGY